MDIVLNFIVENIVLVIIISIPTIYLVIRDLSLASQKKMQHKRRLEEIAASERRLDILYKKINDNRKDLANKIKDIEDKLQDSIDNNEQ